MLLEVILFIETRPRPIGITDHHSNHSHSLPDSTLTPRNPIDPPRQHTPPTHPADTPRQHLRPTAAANRDHRERRMPLLLTRPQTRGVENPQPPAPAFFRNPTQSPNSGGFSSHVIIHRIISCFSGFFRAAQRA